ncbi:hypothetical protein PPO43_10055 [Saprospira sp. CCB-QB6]|uniref:hypothetical protein n=1 Tax=Saprospira sp. CCB-QB6 TaxID=3023936 RepID=UPI0023490FA3|nr:hypothetical protein [Saprospira sp. CCB-QB6]WCL80321.1 hypothetical protein PPO43_10055 [Saprospira sp. CCB-QB6]
MSRWLKPSAHFFGCRMASLFAVGFNPQLQKTTAKLPKKKAKRKKLDERPSDVQQWPSGQTEQAKPAKGRANSELRNSPTRLKGGAAPKKD